MKKIDKKGFTLIELLATIVILGIISTVTVVSVINSYQKSKEKSEEVFIEQIKEYIGDYSSLYGAKLNYDYYADSEKCYENFDGREVCTDVVINYSKDKNIEDIADSIVSETLINPSTKIPCDSSNTDLTIYRDSDYVYCFVLDKNPDNSCISHKVENCSGIYKNWNDN